MSRIPVAHIGLRAESHVIRRSIRMSYFRPMTEVGPASTLSIVLINALRSFWAEPREPDPPRRVWRDWVLVGVGLALAIAEGLARSDLPWWPASSLLQLVPIAALLWRRTYPLASVAVAWSVIAGLDIAAIAQGLESPGLNTMALTIVFPYSLFRYCP